MNPAIGVIVDFVPSDQGTSVPDVLFYDRTWLDDLLLARQSRITAKHASLVSSLEFEARTRKGIAGTMFAKEDTEDKRAQNIAVLGMMATAIENSFNNTGPIRWMILISEIRNNDNNNNVDNGDKIIVNLSAWRPVGIDVDGNPVPAEQ